MVISSSVKSLKLVDNIKLKETWISQTEKSKFQVFEAYKLRIMAVAREKESGRMHVFSTCNGVSNGEYSASQDASSSSCNVTTVATAATVNSSNVRLPDPGPNEGTWRGSRRIARRGIGATRSLAACFRARRAPSLVYFDLVLALLSHPTFCSMCSTYRRRDTRAHDGIRWHSG